MLILRKYELLNDGRPAGEVRLRSEWRVAHEVTPGLWVAECDAFDLHVSADTEAELRTSATAALDIEAVQNILLGIGFNVGRIEDDAVDLQAEYEAENDDGQDEEDDDGEDKESTGEEWKG